MLYIAKSGDLDWCYRCLTDWLTHSHLKDRATQLLTKYKSGALVMQLKTPEQCFIVYLGLIRNIALWNYAPLTSAKISFKTKQGSVRSVHWICGVFLHVGSRLSKVLFWHLLKEKHSFWYFLKSHTFLAQFCCTFFLNFFGTLYLAIFCAFFLGIELFLAIFLELLKVAELFCPLFSKPVFELFWSPFLALFWV